MTSAMDYEKMIRSFRVSDLQTLLQFAGRNKVGKKSELQHRALDLLKMRSQSIEVKIREIHAYRFSSPRGHPEYQEMVPLNSINEPSGSNYVMRPPHQQPMYSMSGRNMSSRNAMINPRSVMSSRGQILAPMGDLNPHSKVMLPNHGQSMEFNQYPLSPDLKFKELPFYDILGNLIKPTSLIVQPNERFREREFHFCFTPQQLNQLERNMDVQIQMRMCVFDITCEQEDEIPPSICVKVNDRIVSLPAPIPTNRPGVEPKRPKKPIDLTNYVRRSATANNTVHISWAQNNPGKPHVFAIYLVQRLSSAILIKRLKDNGVRNPDHTTAVIKEKLCQDRDTEIATMSLRGSLMCPLGKIKMRLPCRALTCPHIQCFDATLYLQMNEKKPKWICPVCDKSANFKDLAIDGLFLDIISKAPEECSEVQFHEDGSWTPVMPVVKKPPPQISEAAVDVTPKVSAPKPKRPIEVIDLESDSDTEDSWPLLAPPPPKEVYVQSDPDSPVIIEPSTSHAQSEKHIRKEIDPYKASTSKIEPSVAAAVESIQKTEPVTLELDSDVDSISNIPGTSFSNTTTFDTPNYSQSLINTFQENVNTNNDNPSENTNKQYEFDFLSLMPNPEESLDVSCSDVTDNDEPEVIDIDDDDDDD